MARIEFCETDRFVTRQVDVLSERNLAMLGFSVSFMAVNVFQTPLPPSREGRCEYVRYRR